MGNRGLYTRVETSVRAILTVAPEMQVAQAFLLEIVSQQPMLPENGNPNMAMDDGRIPPPVPEQQVRPGPPGPAFSKPFVARRPLWQTGALIGLIAIVAVFAALEFRD